MKKLFITALLGLGLSTQANAQDFPSQPRTSVFAEYSAQKGKFDGDVEADMNGFGIGISTSPQQNGLWGKFEYQSNSDYDGRYYELSVGGHLNFLSTERFYAIGVLGMGVGVLDVDGFDQTAYFTIPLGLEAGVNLNKNFSLYGGVGYKWALDISDNDKTRCNDGTTSDSSGSGTCSWHGGINYNYSDNYIGDFDGMTYKAGLRYNF
ncbi:outer membrane beta-barrel protein [Acinetobacter indicus]|uniref:Outer membrane beta-barrel protein n=1 Tax=Acinetobacter indicus TaxID=756892 RepID=A0A6C0Y125_9GAMM|nr:outer membrane beta-barrel protein [Acinetobacter indicus]QIC69819.1 outer membrane beta-barrel protein [Acinetobacter indicus]